ncbi:hypothetical protein PR202_gb00620 [Eleusine coracana subsp. coracana]|uniref:Uncharacterized protein n=1 Tax=Eleusine coracana subsp. coracana TaxID=191504 RepID=A0AAV5DT20_ELECO|nr:hypothetical protein PR202_gb00620 [Eleusine coracana subsp. coracana]
MMEWRKANSNGRIPYKEFFFVGVTTLASALPITCLFPFMYFMSRIEYTVWSKYNNHMAIATRLVLGALNGLLAPIKVNTAWGFGLIVGPALGGYLAQPAEKYPRIFSENSVFGRFPYLLPCLSVSTLSAVILISCTWLPVLSLWAVSNRKYGGLSFSTEDIGEVISVAGAGLLVYQLFIYHWVHKILGTINSSRIASCQEQRGTANGILMTAISFFKAIAPIGAGAM